MDYIAFLSYSVLTAYTPGPNNIMSVSNAGKYGLKKALPFNFGVLFGMCGVMTICVAFTSLLYELIPQIEPYMLCLGAAYILWLAWSIWRDRPHDDQKHVMRTNTVASGIALQFVNVKGYMYGITGMSAFVLPHFRGFFALALFSLLMAFVGFTGTLCWAVFGAAFEKLFEKHRKIMNALMALILAYCAISQIAGLFF